MFDWIKNKIRKESDDDYGDLRSGILNEPEPAFRRQPLEPPAERNYDDFSQKTRDVFEPMSMQPPASDFNQAPNRNYEIMDRLNLIESQLAAVRSMTETINERLKNMEAKLGLQRRY
ncbi:hypothetical protein HYZ41_01535 [archaeon]|nr:hypothetical protein [archaeon]